MNAIFLFHNSFEAVPVEFYFKEPFIFLYFDGMLENENLWLLQYHCRLHALSKSSKNSIAQIHLFTLNVIFWYYWSESLFLWIYLAGISVPNIYFRIFIPFTSIYFKNIIQINLSLNLIWESFSFNRVIHFKFIFGTKELVLILLSCFTPAHIYFLFKENISALSSIILSLEK